MSENAGPQSEWQRLARAAVLRDGASPERSGGRELLSFRVAGSAYAVPIDRVREIVRMRAITPMPRVPAALLGVISLRGEVVEVVDLRRRLGLPPLAPTRTTRIIVLHGEEGRTTGLLVDGVAEVLRPDEEAMRREIPGEPGRVDALCLEQGEFVSILDLARVLDLDAVR